MSELKGTPQRGDAAVPFIRCHVRSPGRRKLAPFGALSVATYEGLERSRLRAESPSRGGAAPEDGGSRNGLGDEAEDAEHEKPQTKVPLATRGQS